ncbi:MAG: hypothetical protein PHS54_02535 [Clostridia bacterium]|nr:hypothetical protein [Clostridia bacterium]
MDKISFTSMITEIVLPLFTGSQIVGEELSSSRDFEAAQGPNGTILIKPSKSDEYRLIVQRNQPFKSNEIILVKAIISELVLISSLGIGEPAYLHKLQHSAIEKAICSSLSENSGYVLLELLSEITKWAERTYEGRELTFGFVINELSVSPNPIPNLHFSKLLSNDFMALLSDGVKSTIEFDRYGYLLKYISLKPRTNHLICPQKYLSFASYCSVNKIGVTLNEKGDMMVFKNNTLIFAKRRGIWNSFDHGTLIDLLSNKGSHTIKEIRRNIYITALDVSFAGNGGCIVYLNRDNNTNQILNCIDSNDLLTENYYNQKKKLEQEEAEKLYSFFKKPIVENDNISFEEHIADEKSVKTSSLISIISGKKFHELNRKLREELVSMDGAIVIDYDGTVIACGAIIKIEAGSSGGGRLAAAKTLAKFGTSLKISTDGIIQGFAFDKRGSKVKPIFTIG